MSRQVLLSYVLLVIAGTLRAEANTGSPVRQTDPNRRAGPAGHQARGRRHGREVGYSGGAWSTGVGVGEALTPREACKSLNDLLRDQSAVRSESGEDSVVCCGQVERSQLSKEARRRPFCHNAHPITIVLTPLFTGVRGRVILRSSHSPGPML